MTEKVIMYTLSTCPVCQMAKEDFQRRKIEFEERVVDDNPDWQFDVIRLTGGNTVPVILEGTKVSVGFGGMGG